MLHTLAIYSIFVIISNDVRSVGLTSTIWPLTMQFHFASQVVMHYFTQTKLNLASPTHQSYHTIFILINKIYYLLIYRYRTTFPRFIVRPPPLRPPPITAIAKCGIVSSTSWKNNNNNVIITCTQSVYEIPHGGSRENSVRHITIYNLYATTLLWGAMFFFLFSFTLQIAHFNIRRLIHYGALMC